VRTTRFAALLVRKERWGLSLRGRLLVLTLAVALAFITQREVLPFLSVSQPRYSEILVVEGWIPSYAMSQAAAQFKYGQYRKVLIVRTFDVEEYEVDADRYELVRNGVPQELIETVYSRSVRKDRTYHLALAVREWFSEKGLKVSSLDVATLGPHARRSRLMFEKAFGNSANIGILALDDLGYDAAHWWRSSEGVREVLGEVIAYIYARFYFVWT
jgi:hypothetical protein